MKLEDVKKNDSPETYSTKAVAQFLGVSISTLLSLVKSGKIKPVNIAKTGARPIHGFTAAAVQDYYDNLQNTSKGA